MPVRFHVLKWEKQSLVEKKVVIKDQYLAFFLLWMGFTCPSVVGGAVLGLPDSPPGGGGEQVSYLPFLNSSSYSTRERRKVQVSYLQFSDSSLYSTRGVERCKVLIFNSQATLFTQQENEKKRKFLTLYFQTALHTLHKNKGRYNFPPSISCLLFLFHKRKERGVERTGQSHLILSHLSLLLTALSH